MKDYKRPVLVPPSIKNQETCEMRKLRQKLLIFIYEIYACIKNPFVIIMALRGLILKANNPIT